MDVLDSHIHFVDPSRADGITWPDPTSPLFRRVLPDDLENRSDTNYLGGCIAVETGRRPSDDEWLANLASSDSRVAGAVLNLQPDLPGFVSRLNEYLDSDGFVGIRLRPIDAYDLSSARLLESLRSLADLGKTIEFGARTQQQRDGFSRLAEKLPGTTFILNHCGHPGSMGASDAAWLNAVKEIASLSNTRCKVTGGFAFEAKGDTIIEALLDAFGPQRLLYGSNWPVSDMPHDFEEILYRMSAMFGDNASDFFALNAQRAYRLATAAAIDTSQEYR